MKNPWMSLWLSTAHSATSAWSGAARNIWKAQMGRQQRAMFDEMTRQTSEFWTGGASAPVPARVRARR